MAVKRRAAAYWGPTAFGVPFMKEDRGKAVDALLEYFTEEHSYMDACTRVIDYNEKIVSRCGVLLNFNSILLALIIFATRLQWHDVFSWQKVVFYVVAVMWSLSNAWLIYSIRHVFPKPHEFIKEEDFRLTADLYIKRMLVYNVTLISSLFAFIVITTIALFPFYLGLEDKALLQKP